MATDTDLTYQSLRRKILASMILVPTLPFVAVLAIGYYSFTQALEDATMSRLIRIAEDHRESVQTFLDERRGSLQFIASSTGYDQLSEPGVLTGIFRNLQGTCQAIVDLGVFDSQGTLVAYEGPYELRGKDYSEADWFHEVRRRGYYVSDVFLGFRNSPHFVIAVAAGSEADRWVLRGTIDTAFFTRLVERVRIGKTGEAYILNRNGEFQTQRRSGGDLLERAGGVLHLTAPTSDVTTSLVRDPAGIRFVAATAWMNDSSWILVVRQEVSDAFSPLRRTTYVGVLILIAGCAVIVLLAMSMTNLTVKRIRQSDEDRVRLGQQLIVASRLAEIGEMSAGFAHEINNPLQIIRSEHALIDTILDDLHAKGELPENEDVSELRGSVDQIRQQVDRCASITQGILKFARRSDPTVKTIRLWEFVPEVLAMVAQQAAVNGIDLGHDVADTSCRVDADPSQLQQVLLNLLNNAFDAVTTRHGASGGKVWVDVEARDSSVTIKVQDNGTGISRDNLSKVFTPFFTTKPVGHGTGLGLSVCFGIIDAMGGTIEIESEDSVGTTCLVTLPRAG